MQDQSVLPLLSLLHSEKPRSSDERPSENKYYSQSAGYDMKAGVTGLPQVVRKYWWLKTSVSYVNKHGYLVTAE